MCRKNKKLINNLLKELIVKKLRINLKITFIEEEKFSFKPNNKLKKQIFVFLLK